jgi:hypothetical protein
VGGVDSTTCSDGGTAQEGPYSNLATASGFYGAARVWDSDASHYLGSEAWYEVYLPVIQR